MLDIEDLDVSPKVFAKMVGTSVSKLIRGESPAERVDQARNDLQEICHLSGEDAETWLMTPLPLDEADVTPLAVWKYQPSVSALMDDPAAELDRVCPQWKLLFLKKGVIARKTVR